MDNAIAQTANGIYKAGLINRRGPWHSIEQTDLATAERVAWWSADRLHEGHGHLPPAELEQANHQLRATTEAA